MVAAGHAKWQCLVEAYPDLYPRPVGSPNDCRLIQAKYFDRAKRMTRRREFAARIAEARRATVAESCEIGGVEIDWLISQMLGLFQRNMQAVPARASHADSGAIPDCGCDHKLGDYKFNAKEARANLEALGKMVGAFEAPPDGPTDDYAGLEHEEIVTELASTIVALGIDSSMLFDAISKKQEQAQGVS